MDDGRDTNTGHPRSGGKHHGQATACQPHVVAAVILLLAALTMLAGCSMAGTTASSSGTTTSGTTTATATSKPCQRIATLDQTLTQLSTVGDNTTVGEVKAIQQKLTTALDAVDKLPGTDGSALSNLQSANDQLTEAIKDLPDSATVGQVGPRFQAFKGKVSEAQTAVAKLASTLHCGV
ncbi:MAG TPA: hypothetical protein VJQ83_03655 [Tepidiformaceae bacterium]|nr:hypothetical protein [Tepidiformaceae bacterium]